MTLCRPKTFAGECRNDAPGFSEVTISWAVDFMLFEVADYAKIYALGYAFFESALCHLCRGKYNENDTLWTQNSLPIEG